MRIISMEKPKQRFYLAYSFNLNPGEMAGTKMVAATELKGYRLAFCGDDFYGVPTIEWRDNGRVPAVLWRIHSWNEASLDRMWRCPELYHKREFEVTAFGKKVAAFTYVLNRLPGGSSRAYGRPSLKRYAAMAAGYRHYGLDRKILDEAIEYSKPSDPLIDDLPF